MQATREYEVTKFIPFNPVDKKTTATVIGPDGKQMQTCKGAPQVPSQPRALTVRASAGCEPLTPASAMMGWLKRCSVHLLNSLHAGAASHACHAAS